MNMLIGGKNMKKIITVCSCICLSLLLLTGCNSKEKNLTGSLTDIMKSVYADLGDDLPMTGEVELTKDNIEYYIGTSDIDFKEALASDALINARAHSVVLVRLNDGADIEKAKKEIEAKANPHKWICVEAEKTIVENRGNVIILIMTDTALADKIQENFQNL